MIDCIAGQDLPDVLYNIGVIAGVPALLVAARGRVWERACVEITYEKLTFRNAAEPLTGQTMFVVFEPPRIDAPILAVDICPRTEQFIQLQNETGGGWLLILQWEDDTGTKKSRMYYSDRSDAAIKMPIGPGDTLIRDGWFWDAPAAKVPDQGAFVVPEEVYQATLQVPTEELTDQDRAHLLIGATERELRKGTRHFNKAGRLLTTLNDILKCHRDEGDVTVQLPENTPMTCTTCGGTRSVRVPSPDSFDAAHSEAWRPELCPACTRRPAEETRTQYGRIFEQHVSEENGSAESALMRRMVRAGGAVAEFVREQFIAACFLEDVLQDLGAPDDYRRSSCFDFGRLCAMRPDIWTNYDRFVRDRTTPLLVERKRLEEWATTPVWQDVPPATELFVHWYDMAHRALGVKGVFPQPFVVRHADGQNVIVALAVDGQTAFEEAIRLVRSKPTAEFVLGVDMNSRPGQGTEFRDFLAVVWYVGGAFYTGVLNYQRLEDVPEGQEPVFRQVDWGNNYWNNSLREYPIPEFFRSADEN